MHEEIAPVINQINLFLKGSEVLEAVIEDTGDEDRQPCPGIRFNNGYIAWIEQEPASGIPGHIALQYEELRDQGEQVSVKGSDSKNIEHSAADKVDEKSDAGEDGVIQLLAHGSTPSGQQSVDNILRAAGVKRIYEGWYMVEFEGEKVSPETVISAKRNPKGEKI